jgi:NDP-sugar pyrophosphorylase family protein
MKAVLLAAGKGTRMQGLCDDLPKPLLPVANRPLLEHTLGQCADAGVDSALLVVGHRQEQVRETLGTRCAGVDLDYVVQENPKGTGQAAALGEEFAAGEPFLLMFGDIVTSGRHLPGIVRVYQSEHPAAALSVRYVPNPASGGAVYLEDERVVRIVERPKPGETQTHHINAGIFVFPPEIFDLLRTVEVSPRGEYELTDAIRMLIEQGGTVRAFDLDGFWVNVTDPTAYLEAQRELLAEIDPPAPDVPPEVRVEERVVIGQGCTLGACVVGPHVSIGSNCTLGAGAHVSDAVVMEDARLGAGAHVARAVVGRGAHIGDGAELVGSADGEAAFVGHGGTV